MKNFLVVLSAAVLAGLSVYAAFDVRSAFSLVGNNVSMNVNVFVALIACLTLVAATASLLLRVAIVRTDRGMLAALEQRIAQLEQHRPAS